MGFYHIVARNKNKIGSLVIFNRIASCPVADRTEHCNNSGCMAKTGTVIYIVVPEHQPYEFLEKVIVLVGAFCR
jgi:hypothetical protein